MTRTNVLLRCLVSLCGSKHEEELVGLFLILISANLFIVYTMHGQNGMDLVFLILKLSS